MSVIIEGDIAPIPLLVALLLCFAHPIAGLASGVGYYAWKKLKR